MEIDSERLAFLVQARPALYNQQLKDHSNKEVLETLWEEVGDELDATGSDCRLKWHNLRSSYSRYLREVKKLGGGSRALRLKKKKWYLADAMSFLDDFLTQNRGMASNRKRPRVEDSEETIEKEIAEDASSCISSQSASNKPSSIEQIKKSPAEMLVAPMTKFLESRVKDRKSPLINFFLGVLPDIERLSHKRQRTFKLQLVELVNKLMDEEDEENATMPYRSPSNTSESYLSPINYPDVHVSDQLT